jgi:hypothetical protein
MYREFRGTSYYIAIGYFLRELYCRVLPYRVRSDLLLAVLLNDILFLPIVSPGKQYESGDHTVCRNSAL